MAIAPGSDDITVANGDQPCELADDNVRDEKRIPARNRYKEQAEQSELFFGLIGATGTDLGMVELGLSDALRVANYVPTSIRLSALIEEHYDVLRPTTEHERIRQAMNLGNKMRELGNDAIALLGALEIRRLREQYWTSNKTRLPLDTDPIEYPKIPIAKRAYIFRSLKHPKEVEILRQIYGDSFHLISAYASRAQRKAALEKRISESEIGNMRDRRTRKTNLLMRRDYIEADLPNGQNVRDTFPLADLFVNADNKNECDKAIMRFVRLIFGDPQQTPTIDEYCMFHAKGAALRSGDLGRQVGAIIASATGDVISHGTNEAPKGHGGQFWQGDDPDGRGIAQKKDISDHRKRTLLIDLLQRLVANERITGIDESGIQNLATEIFSEQRPRWMKSAEILELIGFYRSVHGETAAIINAARLGISTKGHNLYVTAFPCHECARHILAAGIERVIYVEPYPKSLAGEHYPESIAIDEQPTKDQIPFQQFVGIAPRTYMRFFEALERKNKDGSAIPWVPANCCVRYHHHWLAYTEKEAAFCSDFQEELSRQSTIGGQLNDRTAQKEVLKGSAGAGDRGSQELADVETAASKKSGLSSRADESDE